jgi:hypothetical protein
MKRKVKPPPFKDFSNQISTEANAIMEDEKVLLERTLRERGQLDSVLRVSPALELMHYIGLAQTLQTHFLERGKEIAGSGFAVGFLRALDWVEQTIRKGDLITRRDFEKLRTQFAIQRLFLPNKKYTIDMFVYFEAKWDELHSQKVAYEKTAERFGLAPDKCDSFVRSYRTVRPFLKKASSIPSP